MNPNHKVDFRRIDNHQITSIPQVTAGGITCSHDGNVILIMYQHTYHGIGKTIHSFGQIEWNKNDVNDKSVQFGGNSES